MMMKKFFYFAFAAGLSMTSCGAKGESANVAEQTSQNTEKVEKQYRGDRPEGREGRHHHRPVNQEEMIQRRVDRMAEELTLTDEQKKQLMEIYAQRGAKLDSMRAAEREEKREQMKAIFAEEREALKSVLTEEQLAKLDTMKKSGPRGPHHGRPDGKHEGRRHHGPRN